MPVCMPKVAPSHPIISPVNTSMSLSLIDKDLRNTPAITPHKTNTRSEGGVLKTGEVLGEASGVDRIPSARPGRTSPSGQERTRSQSDLGKHRAVVKETEQKPAARGARKALRGRREPPQPQWLSLAGRRQPTKGEAVEEEGAGPRGKEVTGERGLDIEKEKEGKSKNGQ